MEPTWETTDLGTAGYVHMRGLELLGVKNKGGRFVFQFKDPEEKAPNLQVEYFNSDCRRFDSAIRSLKKLCHDSPQNGGRGFGRRG